jgi:hypothetical protein
VDCISDVSGHRPTQPVGTSLYAPSDVYARLETSGIYHPYYLTGTCEPCRSRTAAQEGRMVEDAGSPQMGGRVAETREWAMGQSELRVTW